MSNDITEMLKPRILTSEHHIGLLLYSIIDTIGCLFLRITRTIGKKVTFYLSYSIFKNKLLIFLFYKRLHYFLNILHLSKHVSNRTLPLINPELRESRLNNEVVRGLDNASNFCNNWEIFCIFRTRFKVHYNFHFFRSHCIWTHYLSTSFLPCEPRTGPGEQHLHGTP